MFEFIVGYIIGSSSKNSEPISGKAIAIGILVIILLVGVGYLFLPVMFPEVASPYPARCGGIPVAFMMCQVWHQIGRYAAIIGMALIWFVLFVSAVWFWFARCAHGEKSDAQDVNRP